MLDFLKSKKKEKDEESSESDNSDDSEKKIMRKKKIQIQTQKMYQILLQKPQISLEFQQKLID